MWVVIHMCMEAMPGISLHNYLYLKLAKILSFLLSLIFSLQQNERTRGQNKFCPEVVGRGKEVVQTMYTHVSKCKNDKMTSK
jgi:hypothetical protein